MFYFHSYVFVARASQTQVQLLGRTQSRCSDCTEVTLLLNSCAQPLRTASGPGSVLLSLLLAWGWRWGWGRPHRFTFTS